MARPKKVTKFPYMEVKRANERLRKLETVNRMAQSSEAYKSIERFASDPNTNSYKFYREYENRDGSPGIRFIKAEDYYKMSRYDQMRFDEVVNNFLENKTTTKLGIEKVRKDNYDSFMKNHPDLHWTQDEYEDFWKSYSQAQSDKADYIGYSMLTQIFTATTQFSDNLTPDKVDSLVHYNNKELRYSEAPSKTKLKNRRFRN